LIILYHSEDKVTKVISANNEILSFNKKTTIASVFVDLAIRYPQSKIIWCNQSCESDLNLEAITDVFHHNKIMLSYNPENNFLGRKIGYIDESSFIAINKEVTYPTWQMSSLAGVIHADVLLAVNKKIKLDPDFDYYLTSIAKVCMPLGLLCYSEPKLIVKNDLIFAAKSSNFTLFKFVKQHYKTRWIFLLFLNLMIYEFKFPFIALVYSIFFKNRNNSNINIDDIKVCSSLTVINSGTIDVIIPTIGRKQYLYDVLLDLSHQTILPERVIIVEQNPEINSTSELDYITKEKWPFEIKHIFTHQMGACNARNVALSQVKSEWVFLNDDDNRFGPDLLKDVLVNLEKFGIKTLSTSYIQPHENKRNVNINQSSIFGSGNSFIHSAILEKVKFNDKFEFGYGEDSDFGMQIRNQGLDVLYFPNPEIVHLKAPSGGFRIKPKLAWSNDSIMPKPSPTIMLYKILHETKEQQNGYKTIFFCKYYSNQSIKNPLKYFLNFNKEWKQSCYWADKLLHNS
jgi:GT2 family glycosyltransferase